MLQGCGPLRMTQEATPTRQLLNAQDVILGGLQLLPTQPQRTWSSLGLLGGAEAASSLPMLTRSSGSLPAKDSNFLGAVRSTNIPPSVHSIQTMPLLSRGSCSSQISSVYIDEQQQRRTSRLHLSSITGPEPALRLVTETGSQVAHGDTPPSAETASVCSPRASHFSPRRSSLPTLTSGAKRSGVVLAPLRIPSVTRISEARSLPAASGSSPRQRRSSVALAHSISTPTDAMSNGQMLGRSSAKQVMPSGQAPDDATTLGTVSDLDASPFSLLSSKILRQLKIHTHRSC